MPVEHRLQVLTNNAERLSLAVNGSTFSFTDLHQADITIPAVFLFALPSHKSDEPWATKRRWLTDTQNFLDVYLAFDGKALMIDYAEMPRDSNLVAAFINDGLLGEELLTSFEIAYQGLDWLWSLAFQVEINSYSSTEKLLAVISENTFSPGIGDSNKGAIGPPTMIEILTEYGRGVIAAGMSFSLMFNVSSLMSTKTGVAPLRTTALAVETKVYEGIMTSSPSFKAKKIAAISSAAVQECVSNACGLLVILQISFSQRSV